MWKQNYLPFGNQRVGIPDNTSTNATRNQAFGGKSYDGLTGLSYFGARYYDPVIGRFMAVDPVGPDPEGNIHSLNRYTYANNNPYKYVDPDGRYAESLWDVANVGMGLASLGGNLYAGNFGWAAVDLLGVIADGLATAAPIIPSGVATVIKGGRYVEDAAVGTKKIKDLDPLHSKATVGDRPDLRNLSDSELMNAASNPKDGNFIKENTITGKVVGGNSRTYELQRRAADPKSSITPDTVVPVKSHTPDNSDFWDM